MHDLKNLRLDDIELAVMLYRNVADHRHGILEGIKRIAVQNMLHVGDAIAHAGPRPSEGPDSTSIKAWVARIHAITLADLVLENTELNRSLLEHSTFSPVGLYFALFYAEIEFFDEWRQKCLWICDCELVDLLDNQRCEILIIKEFRDKLLHPQTRTTLAEIELLQQGVHNKILLLNKAFDYGYERVRQTIRNRLINTLNGLPKVQQSYCRFLFLKFAPDYWFGMVYPNCVRDLERAINDLQDNIKNLSNDEKSWTPNHKQSRNGTKLAEYLAYLIPFCPAGSSVQPINRQPPMDVRHLACLLTIENGVLRKRRKGRAIKQVVENIGHYQRILIAVGVLLNEFNHSYARITGHMPVIDPHSDGISMLEDVPVEEICSLIAPGKVGFALLAGLLQVYERVVNENKWAGVPDLDRILVNCSILDSVMRFRNSVFHVPKAHLNPLEVDAAVSGIDSNLLRSLFTGLSEFIRVIAANCLVDKKSNKFTP